MKKFATIDSFQRSTIQLVKQQKFVLAVCNQDFLLDRFQEANKSMEYIQNELRNYLEQKCLKFGRLNFLSNEVLIQMISAVKYPKQLQSFLSQIFYHVHEITLDAENNITQIVSQDREVLDLATPVQTLNKNIEEWLTSLHQSIVLSVKQSILALRPEQALNTAADSYIAQHVGMSLLIADALHFAFQVEEAILKGAPKSLQDLAAAIASRVKQLAQQLLCTSSTQQTQTKTQNLILQASYHLQILNSLAQSAAETLKIDSFEWFRVLKYQIQKPKLDDDAQRGYQRQRTTAASTRHGHGADAEIQASCAQFSHAIGYEYLGNCARLVITPLTEKCFITLARSIQFTKGCILGKRLPRRAPTSLATPFICLRSVGCNERPAEERSRGWVRACVHCSGAWTQRDALD